MFVGFLEAFGWPALGGDGEEGWSNSVTSNVLKTHMAGAEDGPLVSMFCFFIAAG